MTYCAQRLFCWTRFYETRCSCSVRGTPCVLKGDRIYVHCGMYGFCVQSIRRGNWYRYANHCSVRCYINLAKSREENRSRIARYWLPRSKECADLHDVSSSFVRELIRNNNNNNNNNIYIYIYIIYYTDTVKTKVELHGLTNSRSGRKWTSLTGVQVAHHFEPSSIIYPHLHTCQ